MNFTSLSTSSMRQMSLAELESYRTSLLGLQSAVLENEQLAHNKRLVEEETKRVEMEIMWRERDEMAIN